MPRLYILSGPEIGRTLDVEEGAMLGRGVDCEARVRHASVSRRHARIERDGETWIVVDAGSRNGVLVGGRRVERAALVDGTLFCLGELELRFRVAAEREDDELEFDLASRAPATTERVDVDGDEIVLEGSDEIDLGSVTHEREAPSARPAARRRSLGPGAASDGGAASAPARTPERNPRAAAADPSARARARAGIAERPARSDDRAERGILQYQRVADRQGFFASDLAQQPPWVKLLVGLVLVVVFVGLVWGAMRGTTLLRERTQTTSFDADNG